MDKISPDKYFLLADGTYLKSIEDLKRELKNNCENKNLENFTRHVSNTHNDYANWLKHVFNKENLSKEIFTLKNPQDIFNAIIKDEHTINDQNTNQAVIINNLSKKIVYNVLEKDLVSAIKNYKELKNIYLNYSKSDFKDKQILKSTLDYLYKQIKLLQIELKNKKESEETNSIIKKVEDSISKKDFIQSVKEYKQLKNIYIEYPIEKKQEKLSLKKELIRLYTAIKQIKPNQESPETEKINSQIKKVEDSISKKDFIQSVKEYKQLKNIYIEYPIEKKDEKLKLKDALFYYFDKIKYLQNEIKKQIDEKKLAEKDNDYDSLKKEVGKKIETPQEFLERIANSAEKLAEKTKKMKKNSYMNIEKQKESTSTLREKYEDLASQISEHRKKGKDMFVPYMHLRLIKPKLQFLEVSNNAEERENISVLLKNVEEDIDEALEKFEPDLKKEVLIGAGLYEEKINE